MPFSFEKRIAIDTNYHHLLRMCKDDGIVLSELELWISAKWNYKTFGFGKVSLNEYLHFKEKKDCKRLYNTDVKLWYKIINFVFKRDNYTCTYCGIIGGKLEADHIIPLSKGGTNSLKNLTTSCRLCNRQKKDKSVSEFIEWKTIKNNI